MQDFFNNISRYPRYFITITLGIFFALFEWVRPLFKNRVTTAAAIGIVVSTFVFLYFTLKAMLGLTAV